MYRTILSLLLCVVSCGIAAAEGNFDLTLRTRSKSEDGRLEIRHDTQQWDATKTAVIVCDITSNACSVELSSQAVGDASIPVGSM